jgi:tRNA(Arg) A34 adenosine deaminase TadA
MSSLGSDTNFIPNSRSTSPATQSTLTPNVIEILGQIDFFIDRQLNQYLPGQDLFWGCLALKEAATALRERNYGIGAVAIEVLQEEVRVFLGHNRMINIAPLSADLSDSEVYFRKATFQMFGHAEMDALLRLKSGIKPDLIYNRNENVFLKVMELGIHVTGTLEPCPMCTCGMTNGNVVRNLSNAPDPQGAYIVSDPKMQPPVWRGIQASAGMSFGLVLGSDELTTLSSDAFTVTRVEIDSMLAKRSS